MIEKKEKKKRKKREKKRRMIPSIKETKIYETHYHFIFISIKCKIINQKIEEKSTFSQPFFCKKNEK